jgi:hypothetical protein
VGLKGGCKIKMVNQKARHLRGFQDVYEEMKRGGAYTLDEVSTLMGYERGDVVNSTVRKRIQEFTKWARLEHGVILQSTTQYRIYPEDEVEEFRRKPGKKKSSGSFEPSE